MIEIRITSNPRFLTVVRAMLCKLCELIQCTEDERRKIVLAVDEACANIIKHTYKSDPTRTIEILCNYDCGCLEFILKDSGPAVDPELVRPRDLDELRPGGLGTHFIRSIMDEVEYSFDENSGNVLRMTKRLAGQEGAPGHPQKGGET